MAGQFEINLISNGSTSSGQFDWPGGQGFFTVVATFGGATVKLQYLGPDGATLVDVSGASFTAAGGATFSLPPCKIQATVSGGTPSAIYASAARILRG
jgi:hypothetical protein